MNSYFNVIYMLGCLCSMMQYYKKSILEEDAGSSTTSVHFSEGISATSTHIRYHVGILSIWRKRSTMEKMLIITTVLMFILLLFSLFSYPQNKKQVTEEYCLTEACVHTAANILSSIDNTVDPCDDFYEFSCGNWIRLNPIPTGKAQWNTFNKLEYRTELILKDILEKTNMTSSAHMKAKIYYMSCLDENRTIERLDSEPLLHVLASAGGWNVVRNISIPDWNFEQSLFRLKDVYDNDAFFSWIISEDDRNSSRRIIQIDQNGLTLPSREYYLDKKVNAKWFNACLEYMTKIGVLLGGELNSTKQQMEDVLEFETKLALIMDPDDKRHNEEVLYNKMPIKKLQKFSSFISWQKYFNSSFAKVNRTITEAEEVMVMAPDYFTKLDALLKDNYLRTDSEANKTILHNYLFWHTTRALVPYLSSKFRRVLDRYISVFLGVAENTERWRTCVSNTNDNFGYALGALYVQTTFEGNSKYYAENMIRNIKKAFKDNFKHLKWMDKETTKLAEQKADAMEEMIGFPDFILIPKELDKVYKNLVVTPEEFFENNLYIFRNDLMEDASKLDSPVNKSGWALSPSTVNAYYSPSKNCIVFPAGILQPPFFDQDQLLALNYGAMGVVVGHELTHGFDDQGGKYDKNGNMHQWWNSDTIERFQRTMECFISQYGSHKINGKNISGLQTLGENIADNGGLKASYHAYLKEIQKQNVIQRLPGVNYTQNQLFFISFAQVWCTESTPEFTFLLIQRDVHAPSVYRVQLSVSNMKEFSQAFNCPIGSNMNPEKKCELW